MADTKSLRAQIAKDVAEIKNDNKKHFGTKMPSDGNLEKEQTEQELTYSQMIMGSLASMIWGVKNKNKDQEIKSLLGKGNTIYDLVDSIKNDVNSNLILVKNQNKFINKVKTSIENFFGNKAESSFSKQIEKLIASQNAGFDLLVNGIIEIISSIDNIKINKESNKKSNSLKDSTNEILINISTADTIKKILDDFDKLKSFDIFENDNVKEVQDLLNRLDNLGGAAIIENSNIEKIEELLNKLDTLSKENIYLIINTNLDEQIKNLKQVKIDIYNPNCLDELKASINELKNEKIELFNIDSINKVDELLKSIDSLKGSKTTGNVVDTLKSLFESIKKIKTDDLKADKTQIQSIVDLFNDDGDIKKLLDAIEKRGEQLTGDKIKILNDAFNIINIASKLLMEDHDVKINKKLFKDLNIILTDEQYIKGLIEHLNGLNVELNNNVLDNLRTVDDFISAVSSLGNLGFIKLVKSKIAIMAINKFLVKDIKSLIETVSTFKTVNKDTSESFKVLNNLFDSITKLGDITISNKRKMAKNIMFIEKFLAEDIKTLIEKSIPNLDADQNKGFAALEKTKGIIDSLISIGDIDKKKINLASSKIDILKNFITEDIKELFKSITTGLGSKDKLNAIIDLTELTKEIFDNINDINESIPSVMSLVKSNVKITLLTIEFAFIEEIFNTLTRLSKILKNKDKQFLSNRFDGTLDSIIEINGILASVNTKQAIKDILALDDELAHMYWCTNFIKEIAESYDKVLKFNEFKKTIQNIKSAIDSIDISKEDYKKLDSLAALLDVMYALGKYTSDSTTFDANKFNEATEAIVSGAVPFILSFIKDSELDKNLKSLMTVNDKTLDKFEQIIELIKKFDQLSKIAVLSKVSNIGLEGISKEAEYIKVIIGKFADIDAKEIKKAESSLNLFKKLVIMSAAILIVGALAMKLISLKDLIAFAVTLSIFLFAVTGVFKIISKSIQSSMDGAKDAALLIAASGFVMLLGGYIMEFIDFGNLVLFTVSLSIFLFAITGIFKLFSKGFENALDGAQDAMIIVATSALIMLLGSKLVRPEDFISSLLFAVELGIFLAAIGLAFKVWKGFDSKSIMASAEDLCLIIGISAIALILGGLASKYVGIADLLLFTLELTVLIGGTIGIFMAASKFTPGALDSAKDIALLIGVSGLVLILAGVLANQIKFGWLLLFELELAVLIGGVLALYAVVSMIPTEKYIKIGWELSLLVAASGLILILAGVLVKYIDLGSLFLFTVILGAFIAAILFTYAFASKKFKSAFKGATEMAILIGASALILILGSIAVKEWIDIPSLIIFTVTLAGFIFAITFTYKLFGKQIEKSIMPAIALSLLTAISGLVLIMGGKYLLDNPGLSTAILEFGILLIGYVALMGGVCYLLGKFMPKIMMGIAAMTLLLIVTAISTLVIDKISTVVSQEGFLKNILKGVIAIAGVITAIGGIAFAAGALVMGPQALLFIAGAAAIGTIVTIALLAAQAVKGIVQAMIAMKSVEKFDAGIMINNIKGFIEIVETMKPIADSFKTIMKTSIAIATMSSALSSVATTLKNWSDLKIPVYEGTKVVGYKALVDSDFTTAADHIKQVVTTLGQAIIDVYNEAPEGMFDPQGWHGLGKSKFALVVQSLKIMGPTLSSIADGVKDWSDLKIPVYNGTKVVGYKTITNTDFEAAANNIKQVIITLGGAVIDTYNEAENKGKEGMFDPQGWHGLGKSKFALVVQSLKVMGPMLSSIADGVKDWSDLKIPVYKGTEVVGYKTLSDTDFKKAGDNIKDVIVTLGKAVLETYNAAPEGMFDPQGWHGLGKSKFALVAQSFKTMGPMLSSIANAVKEWVDLKIPIYEGTKVVGYMTLENDSFNTAAEHIKQVLKCVGEALVEVVEKNPKIFGDDMFTDGPAIVAANAMKIMSETLNLSAFAVAAYASGKFPIFDKDGKFVKNLEVNLKDPNVFKTAAENIKKVLVCIGNALKETVEDSDIFNDGIFGDAPAIKAAEAIKGMSEALNNSVYAITKISELNLEDLHAALDPSCPTKDNIYHRLNDLLGFTVDIYRLFVSEDSSMATTGKVSHWWRSDTTEKLSFAEYLDEHNGDVKEANDALGTFTNMISSILDSYSEIGKTINDNQNNLKVFAGGENSQVYKYLNDSMTSVSAIIGLLINEDRLDLFDKIDDKEDDILKGVKSTVNICNTLLSGVLNMKKIFDEISSFNILQMIPMITSFNKCVNALSKIGTEESNSIKISLPVVDAEILSSQIYKYASALELIIKINERAKAAGEEGFNVLRDGILKIYSVTSSIENLTPFKNHTDDLSNYIKTINSIDLTRLNSLNNFVSAMNQLSSRLGSLDNLTDAIANRLSMVLHELVDQLMKADQSIKNAHVLQEKRKKLIEEATRKVEQLMGQTMKVEIYQAAPPDLNQKTDTEDQSTPSGKVNGNEITNNNATEYDENTNKVNDYNSEPNAEEKRADMSGNNQKALTRSEFENLMKTKYIKEIAKAVRK